MTLIERLKARIEDDAATIAALREQLAEARGEPDRIVEWLRGQADKGDEHLERAIAKTDEAHQHPEFWAAGVVAIRKAADAIAARAYVENTSD